MSRRQRPLFRAAEIFFWGLAVLLLGLYALVYMDRSLYQAYESWAFNQRLQHGPAPVLGFLLDKLRFGGEPAAAPSTEAPHAYDDIRGTEPSPLAPGALLGRIEIRRVGVRAMVINGTTDEYLRRAIGHIEGTALPGQPGNVGLAGHRDTFFRGLRHIRKGDVIDIQTLNGTFKYVVESTQIVGPGDVQVLEASSDPALTLVTCYPFDYIGTAPHRFIVHAREVSCPAAAPQGS